VTGLGENETHLLRMQKIDHPMIAEHLRTSSGYILPLGARVMIELSN